MHTRNIRFTTLSNTIKHYARFPQYVFSTIITKNTWEKGLTYAYRDRRNKKRNFRALWIQRINAAARLYDMSYSQLMGALHKAGIEINRKVLADLAVNNQEAFKAIVDKVK